MKEKNHCVAVKQHKIKMNIKKQVNKKKLYCCIGSPTYSFGNLPEGLAWLNIVTLIANITVKKTGHKQQQKTYT